MNKNLFFPLLLITAVLCNSCHKNAQPTWDTQILAPLVSASMSINDIVTSKYVVSNPDNSVKIVFTDTLYNLTIDSLLKIPDTTIQYPYGLPIAISEPPNTALFTKASTIQLTTGQVQLTHAIINSGFAVVTIKNDVHHVMEVIYTIPGATLNGGKFDITFIVDSATSAGPGVLDTTVSLARYNIDFTGTTFNQFNTIATQYTLGTGPGGTAYILGGDSVYFNVTFHNIIPYYAQGYFGQSVHKYGPEQDIISFFNKVVSGSINLDSVDINLTLQNGFGVDARLTLDTLSSINTRTNNTVYLKDNELINRALNINAATPSGNPSFPVKPSVQTFSLHPSNSNILAWVDNLPNKIGYSVQIETDPIGNVSGSHDFAYLNYGIGSFLNITVPLKLIATNLILADTISANFSGNANANQVKSGVFTLYASNGFPFNAGIQLFVLDSNLSVKDSLLIQPNTITAGQLNGVGIVVNSTNSTLSMPLDARHAQEFINAYKLKMYVKFNIGQMPNQYIAIYNYYRLSLKLVGNFDYLVKG